MFLSLPCWESAAPWAEPLTEPLRFALSLFVAATGAMLACHLGPAFLATKFGDRPRHRFSQVLLLWFGFGYFAWLLSLTQSTAGFTAPGTVYALVATVVIIACIRSWWKPLAACGLLLGAGILIWALATTWHGLWTRNPFFSEAPAQFDWLIIRGLLLCAGPAIVIAWRIGCIESAPKRIWSSGFWGLWLPMVFSHTAASMAKQAGENLYWRPTLLRGFNWALLGSHGRISATIMTLTTCTLLCPVLVSVVSLRLLLPLWTRWQKI